MIRKYIQETYCLDWQTENLLENRINSIICK